MMRIQGLCLLLVVALVGSAVGGTYSDLVLATDDLVAYWDFQDGSTTDQVNDTNGIGGAITIYDGWGDPGLGQTSYATETEVASLGSGVGSSFLGFDANNEGIQKIGDATVVNYKNYGYAAHFSDSNLATGDYSISFWFKSTDSSWTNSKLNFLLTDINSGSYVGGLFIGGGLDQYGTTGVLCYAGDGITEGSTILSNDTWYNITLVRDVTDTNTMDVYLNGVLEIEDASGAAFDGNTFALGGRMDETSDSHTSTAVSGKNLSAPGIYDELAVWNTALDGNQVAAVYNAAFTAANVPEPSTVVLLMTAVAGLLFWRRK